MAMRTKPKPRLIMKTMNRHKTLLDVWYFATTSERWALPPKGDETIAFDDRVSSFFIASYTALGSGVANKLGSYVRMSTNSAAVKPDILSIMTDLFRESAVGQVLRLVVQWKFLRYPEELDAGACDQFVSQSPGRERVSVLRHVSSGLDHPNTNEDYGDLTLSAQVTRIRSSPTASSDFAEKTADEAALSTTFNTDKSEQKIVGWSGPDDPGNPQNWSFSKKVAVSAQICYMTFAVYVGAGIYSAAVESITVHFGVSSVAATLGLTCFVAGYGLGPMIWAPIGEAPPIGRALVYIVCLTIFVVFQLGVALAANFGMLLAFRFLTGFFGSPVLATGGASMSVPYAVGCWGAVAVCGPTLGPLLGGFAAMAEGWTWPIWILMWASGLSLFINLFFLPETSASTILYRRAARVRRITGLQIYHSAAEIEASKISKKDLAFEALLRPFQLCFTEPVIFIINLYIALIYGILYLFFEAFPIVYIGIYGFNLGQQGLAWLGLFVGSVVGTGAYFVWIAKVRSRHITAEGLKPEENLPPAMVGGILISGSMIWFAWVARASVHWIVSIIATAFFAIGGCALVNCAFMYLMAAYPAYAASALASNDFLRSMVAAGFPLFGAATFNNLGVDWASTMLGLLTAVFIPAPFLFYRYGGKLRLMSRKANHEMVD